MSKIFITGDKHADINTVYHDAQINKMTDEDYLIICGDFGFIWDGGWEKNIYKLQKACPATILFIDGNHENFNILESLPIKERFGAPVHVCGEKVFHLMRGNIYTINGHTFFAFGGARSTDKQYRTVDKSWWFREEPTIEEMDAGQQNLYANLDKIEYVLTHEAPGLANRELLTSWMTSTTYQLDYALPGRFNNWFENLYYDAKNFKTWFFGHLHLDEPNIFGGKMAALYYDIVVIEED